MKFTVNSSLIPNELHLKVDGMTCKIPPVVYAHILCVLCNFHLNNVRLCRESIKDLQLTIAEEYLMPIHNLDHHALRPISYNCL